MKKQKVIVLKVFTDEWKFLFAYCSEKAGKKLGKEIFPDIDCKFENRRGLTFYKTDKVPLIWINSDLVKGKQRLYTTIHESYHLVRCIGDWTGIDSEEWFAETMEYVVKQIMDYLDK
jgi:hypothetical protein